jgi:CheY-like chemotaxis protein
MSRIVMIEDNPDSARLAKKLLNHAGHEVVVAGDGETGLTAVLEHFPELILIDLGLPDIDGQTVIAMLRQLPDLQQAKIVAFTAWPEEQAAEMARAYGCDGVITKPIDAHRFPAQVSMYLPEDNARQEQRA